MHYIIHVLKSGQPILKQQQKKRFAIGPFLEKEPHYSKEERSLTILVLILQTLFLMEAKKMNAAANHINQLINLANRQLKQEGYHRAIQFIRLLRLMEKAHFKFEDIKNAEKHLGILRMQPFIYRGLIKDLEIIRYEKLWELILEKADN